MILLEIMAATRAEIIFHPYDTWNVMRSLHNLTIFVTQEKRVAFSGLA